MSGARTEMLARVRNALAGAPVQAPPEQRDYRTGWDGTREEMLDLFAGRVAEYRAQVTRIAADSVHTALTAACSQHGVGRLVIDRGLPDAWRPSGVELVEDDGLSAPELDELDGAITGCAVAIAETGTVVLDAGPGQGRRAITLVPDLHICVVEAERVVGLVPEAVERLAAAVEEGRPLTFVSGPSATSDIELQRVEGVHGPRTLHVVLAGEALVASG